MLGAQNVNGCTNETQMGSMFMSCIYMLCRGKQHLVPEFFCYYGWNMGLSPYSWIKATILQWHHRVSTEIKKFETSISAKKIVAWFFWDRRGFLLIVVIPQGKTIIVDAYCEILRCVWQAIQNKRKWMLTCGISSTAVLSPILHLSHLCCSTIGCHG